MDAGQNPGRQPSGPAPEPAMSNTDRIRARPAEQGAAGGMDYAAMFASNLGLWARRIQVTAGEQVRRSPQAMEERLILVTGAGTNVDLD